jgi:eukaryotic-like serine/threonine-protein kinase
MGEVYLAEDTRLGRKVALKLLPADYTKNEERLRRFEQEARAASALNHPNILTIYETGSVGDAQFIATEFVDGETLREQMAGGALGVEEALEVATQVASALVAAHQAKIVHRDIKPENVMLRRDRVVKVLDFGLAKLSAQGPSSPEATTRAAFKTDPGVVMGTVQYMSPEQARGLEVDERTDIWSLGCVLYEMVAGRAPFSGETTSDALAAVLAAEPPPLARYSKGAPEALEWIIIKALTKDKEERYQTAREMLTDLRRLEQRLKFAAELERSAPPRAEAAGERERAAGGGEETAEEKTSDGKGAGARDSTPEGTPPSPTVQVQPAQTTLRLSSLIGPRGSSRRRRAALFVIFAVVICTVVAFALYKLWPRREAATAQSQTSAPAVTATVKLTYSPGLDIHPTFSPDGNSVAYSSDQSGGFEIYVRQLTPGGREIQLTNDGQQNMDPAWSPDGQHIAYHSKSRGGIWVVPALGGLARQLTDFGSNPAWSRDGSAVAFQSLSPDSLPGNSVSASTIWVVPAQGGQPRQLTQVGSPPGGHNEPAWSPDGKRILFVAEFFNGSRLWSVSADGGDLKELTRDAGRKVSPVYSRDGQSVYYGGVSGGAAYAMWRLGVTPGGDPVGKPLEVLNAGGAGIRHIAVSADGSKLAYSLLSNTSNLWSVPVSKATGEAAGPPVQLTNNTSLRNNLLSFSPDGRKIALTEWRGGTAGDIWVVDADGKNPVQLTTDPNTDSIPDWFPDGNRIAFLSNRTGHFALWATTLSGGRDTLLLDINEDIDYGRLSPDGRAFAFNSRKGGPVNTWVVALEGGEPRQLTFDKEMAGFPCWSPDGRWLAVEFKRGEETQIALMPSGGGDPVQLTSEHGDSWPHSFSPDGDKIAFAGRRGGVWNIYWVSRSTRQQKRLTDYSKLNAFVRYPAWSPLGTQIVYEYNEVTGNIWTAELK